MGLGNGLDERWFGWVFVVFGDPQMVRTLHHLAMWYLLLFAFIHMYMVFREDIMSGEIDHRHDGQRHPHVQARARGLSAVRC